MRRNYYILWAVLGVLLSGCGKGEVEAGVPEQLARERASNISELCYDLEFVIPEQKDSCIYAEETISFRSSRRQMVVLDFREDASRILGVSVNGRTLENSCSSMVNERQLDADGRSGKQRKQLFGRSGYKVINERQLDADGRSGKQRKQLFGRSGYKVMNEHIVIPRELIFKGSNSICINFIAGEQSLNRREDLMYTLLVPDRARTVFPCFDQPNLKASFKLTLDVPAAWTAVSNTAIASIESVDREQSIVASPCFGGSQIDTGNGESPAISTSSASAIATESSTNTAASESNTKAITSESHAKIAELANSTSATTSEKSGATCAGSTNAATLASSANATASDSSTNTAASASSAKSTTSENSGATHTGSAKKAACTGSANATASDSSTNTAASASSASATKSKNSATTSESNTSAATSENDGAATARKRIRFRATEPLSTYLFSFVVGRLESYTEERGGHEVTLYHRETDPARISQCHDIMQLVFDSLDFLEEYTAIPYPFAKYDLIAIPSFQYGGMEHTGATLYNDKRIFLGPNPTTEEILGRASLIAHETAHMWFGDYVTMKWFDDVWIKEVFANWMAAKMVRPQFPQMDHTLGDLKSYYAAAYSEDRTAGSNAVQRPLSNLRNAGLIYCNIIYDKAPIVMEKLAARMGYDQFQLGVRDYLRRFGYSNATWDDLIACLEPYAGFDLENWSRVWIKEEGMPEYEATINGNKLTVKQIDPFGQGRIWQQELQYRAIGRSGESEVLTLRFDGQDSASASAPFEISQLIPNSDGLGYGCFRLSEDEAEGIWQSLAKMDADCRMAAVMNLYENAWRGWTAPENYVRNAAGAILQEKEPLILSTLISYSADAARMAEAGNNGELASSRLVTAEAVAGSKAQAVSQQATKDSSKAQAGSKQATAETSAGSKAQAGSRQARAAAAGDLSEEHREQSKEQKEQGLVHGEQGKALTEALQAIVEDASQAVELRLLAFRQLYRSSGFGSEDVYAAWESKKAAEGLMLSESDLTSMAFELMVRMPERYSQIVSIQRQRISNPDRLRSFDFIARAAAPEKAARDEFFRALMEPQNRRPESDALTALGLLVHPMRAEESMEYIYPALAELLEIQRTGDIFFPASWAKRLLGGRYDEATATEVRRFLKDHTELDPLLLTKVKQAAGYLLREIN